MFSRLKSELQSEMLPVEYHFKECLKRYLDRFALFSIVAISSFILFFVLYSLRSLIWGLPWLEINDPIARFSILQILIVLLVFAISSAVYVIMLRRGIKYGMVEIEYERRKIKHQKMKTERLIQDMQKRIKQIVEHKVKAEQNLIIPALMKDVVDSMKDVVDSMKEGEDSKEEGKGL